MNVRRQIRRYLSPSAYLRGLVNRQSEMRVLRGPFVGMRYVTESYGSAYLPKVVGCYERELYGAIEDVIATEHDLIVDVGSAEGYFSVGLATRCAAPIVAYEMEEEGRKLSARLAEQNGVAGRIDQRGECDAAMLEQTVAAADNPFVLVDVEGAEAEILDPEIASSLNRATVLVELHEFARPGITAILLQRFAESHTSRMIWEEGRSSSDYPYSTMWTRVMPSRYLRRAVEEHRGVKQSWLLLTPREAASARAAA